MFPWWCVFIAYGLSALIAVVSLFFIIIRGIEFGDTKIQKWLTTLLSSFFSSVILVQPLKVSRRMSSGKRWIRSSPIDHLPRCILRAVLPSEE